MDGGGKATRELDGRFFARPTNSGSRRNEIGTKLGGLRREDRRELVVILEGAVGSWRSRRSGVASCCGVFFEADSVRAPRCTNSRGSVAARTATTIADWRSE